LFELPTDDVNELDEVLDQVLEEPIDQSDILEIDDQETINPSVTLNGGWVTRLRQFAGKPPLDMGPLMPNGQIPVDQENKSRFERCCREIIKNTK